VACLVVVCDRIALEGEVAVSAAATEIGEISTAQMSFFILLENENRMLIFHLPGFYQLSSVLCQNGNEIRDFSQP